MWLLPDFDKTLCPRHYNRLITKMCLNISTQGEKNGVALVDVMYLTTTNVYRARQRQALNVLEILKIDFINSLGHSFPDWTRSEYY